MSPISYGNVFLVCFLFAVDQEAIAGVGPYSCKESGERLSDDVTEGGHAALCEKCDDRVADQGGCADRKQNHQDVENDAQRRVCIRLEGHFAVEHKGDGIADRGGNDKSPHVTLALKGKNPKLKRAVVERLKHPGLQNIVDDQLNDRRQAACKCFEVKLWPFAFVLESLIYSSFLLQDSIDFSFRYSTEERSMIEAFSIGR